MSTLVNSLWGRFALGPLCSELCHSPYPIPSLDSSLHFVPFRMTFKALNARGRGPLPTVYFLLPTNHQPLTTNH